MKVAIIFPRQGSQYLGMGKEFREKYNECSALMAMAEASCELPLESIIDSGPDELLGRAINLQPAITVTNLICWQALLNETAGKLEVSAFAGHSLGEYSALSAAGVISPENGIRLVKKRGELMGYQGDENPGGMRAVIGLEIGDVERILDKYNGPGVVTAANHNTPLQIVISGSMEGLDGVTPLFVKQGAKVIPLNVSVANHSPLVAGAVPEFSDFLETITFHPPQIPVYCNVSAAKESDQAVIKELMARQIVSRVHWYSIITAMLEDGIDTFIEVGPKNVLKSMMRKILSKGAKVASLQFDDPKSLDKCLETLGIS